VLPGQVDTSARLITWLEQLGWPTPERIAGPEAGRLIWYRPTRRAHQFWEAGVL